MKGEYRDRGNIKWTAMMLPEHKVMLTELERNQADIEPPALDPDRLAELSQQLSYAMIDGNEVTVTYWKNKRHCEARGTIKRIDPVIKAVLLEGEDNFWIPAGHIVDVFDN